MKDLAPEIAPIRSMIERCYSRKMIGGHLICDLFVVAENPAFRVNGDPAMQSAAGSEHNQEN
jgi:hypothetical protein